MDEGFYSDDFPVNWQCDGPWTAPFGRIAVSLNGERLFVMGLESAGAMGIGVHFSRRIHDPKSAIFDITASGSGASASNRWLNAPIAPDDVIRIEFLPPGEFDPPEWQKDLESNEVRRRQAPWSGLGRGAETSAAYVEGLSPRVEIAINGEAKRTMGPPADGLLNIRVGAVYTFSSSKPPIPELDFGIDAFRIDEAQRPMLAGWKLPTPTAGDTVTFRILGRGEYDPCDVSEGEENT